MPGESPVPAATAPVVLTGPAAELRGLRVLLVEGDALTRDFLCGILEGDGMSVLACDSAWQALDGIAGFAPDAFLAALPPGGNGAGIIAGVRAQPSLAFLPIILLAGKDDESFRYEAIAAGADEFLLKPVSPQVLLAAIRGRVARAGLFGRTAPAIVEPARRGGALRRGEFLSQLGAVLRGGPPPWQVLVALRVDQAKQLGETLGQAASFELEQAIAERFSTALQAQDAHTLWMAFGFGVLAQREGKDEIEALAASLCRCVADAPFQVRGKEYRLTVSAGVALAPGGADAGDPDRWFASAHAAQSIAHRHGGNRFDGVLSRDHGSMPPERVMIIREWVKEAIAGENVLIEFQPILPLKGELSGMYHLDARLRDFRAPLAGVPRRDYLGLAREAGALQMIDRMSLFSAFEAIEEERWHGRATRVLVPMDLASIDETQLIWLDAELRRRKAHSDGLVIEFDAEMALGRPELARVVQRLEDQGVAIAIADDSGTLQRIAQLQRFPAGLLRLPITAIDSVAPAEFARLLGPWRASGRGLIADSVGSVDIVSRLWEMQVGYVQGDALAAGGPRLDYEFAQFGL